MTKKQLLERRERNQRLAEQDRRNRCPICLTNLLTCAQTVRALGDPKVYCSVECLADGEAEAKP